MLGIMRLMTGRWGKSAATCSRNSDRARPVLGRLLLIVVGLTVAIGTLAVGAQEQTPTQPAPSPTPGDAVRDDIDGGGAQPAPSPSTSPSTSTSSSSAGTQVRGVARRTTKQPGEKDAAVPEKPEVTVKRPAQAQGQAPEVKVVTGGAAGQQPPGPQGTVPGAPPAQRKTAGGAGGAGAGAFEPTHQKELPYGEVPDTGEVIQLDAPGGPIPVTELLDAIAQATNWNIITSKGIEGLSVRFWVSGIKAREALEVLRFNNVFYRFDPDKQFLYVMTSQEYLDQEYGALQKKEFIVRHADVVDMESILTSLLSANGRILSDPRTGNIIVWDTASNLDAMTQTVKRLDVALEPRTYEFKHLNPKESDLTQAVQSMLSERGVAQFDSRSNTLVVTDLPARQDQIGKMLEAMDRPVATRTWTLRYADAEIVSERLDNNMPGGLTLTYDTDTHQVSVTAADERLDEIDGLIGEWDVKGRQVLIEAFLVSAGTKVKRDLGINWSYFDERDGSPFAVQTGTAKPDYAGGPDAGQRFTLGQLPYQVVQQNPLTGVIAQQYVGLDKDGKPTFAPLVDPEFKGNRIAAVLDYLDRKGDVNILSRPRVTVQDGQEATFENTTDLPYQEGGYSQYTGVDVVNPSFNRVIPLSVNFVTVGTILKVKPRINDEDNVLLDLETEDSSADEVQVTVGDQNSTIPKKTQNKAKSQVLVHDGQTIVIGGLRTTSIQDNVEKVPMFGDLPFIGKLFRTTKKENDDRELFIFITTTIVDEYTHPEAERAADLEESGTATMRHSEKSMFGRAFDRITNNRNELGVSIGQGGDIHSEGKRVTLDDLRTRFAEAARNLKPKVIIRSHPRAPKEIETEVADLALEAGLKLEYDDNRVPFVPAYREPEPPARPEAPEKK